MTKLVTKKSVSALLATLMTASALSGCQQSEAPAKTNATTAPSTQVFESRDQGFLS